MLQVPAEVFAAGGLRRLLQRMRVHVLDCLGHQGGTGVVVGDRWDTLGVPDLRGRPGRDEQLLDQFREQVPELTPHQRATGTQRPQQGDLLRHGVERRAAVDRAEGQHGAGTRIDPARQQPGQTGDEQAGGVDGVRGEVRTGGVPARTLHDDLDDIGRRGDRPGAHADLSGTQLRLGVDGEDVAHTLQCPGADDVGRPTVEDLLGGLEDAAHPLVQSFGPVVLRQGAGQGEHHSGVDVVTAGVHDARILRGELESGDLGDRQGVDVGAEGHGRLVGVPSDVDDEAGAGQQHRLQADAAQRGVQERGGLHLFMGQLGVGVEVAAPADDVVVVVDQPGVDSRLNGAGVTHGS